MIENNMKNIANLKKKKVVKTFNFLMNFVFEQIVFFLVFLKNNFDNIL